MDQKSKLRQIAAAAIMALGVVQGVNAQAQPENNGTAGVVSQPATTTALLSAAQPAQAQVQTSALTPEEAKQSAAGNVAELQQMIKGSDLSELRTTYNGSYGTSLLFLGKDMTYYVALFQQKNFWRVIKTQDAARAEMIYRDFVRQTVQLSDVEIRRTQLEAQKAFTERMIALSQGRANRLQADLDVARQQQTIVANQQQQTRAETVALAQQKTAAQEQLRTAQRQVRELQRQLESGLPSH
ncbi:DUF2968 domain-containing protein [Paraburkholderia rhynchosiae]|uniref:DUF2968 domain-containing protein n=1 Tax=Paraburkholderia rhynchosiae TaxID=487049 RepID=A0A2N7WK67_9BURK|nr:DUF2968 domain-containing protein [Paraburkholderia rhynchosiae]PMS29764.1 hypothetical protein C0Z16_17405 [Paraburkholderia rhynchosiae]CAB3698190.1 hypothetical protein LMG27174_03527 [Paraburkholderia rhynchosiae]